MPSHPTTRAGSELDPAWTTVPDLLATLQARWQRGAFLRAHAARAPFEPVSLPVRAPKAAELADRFEDVKRWVERFDLDNRTGTPRQLFDIDWSSRRTRVLGDNPVPVRGHVPSFERLCAVLGVGGEVRRLDEVLELTKAARLDEPSRHALVEWIEGHPRQAIEHHEAWEGLLSVVAWIVDHSHDRANLDVRHLDVSQVDTKFVERHRKILSRLLEQVVPQDQVDRTATSFAGRFGFRPRSTHLRFRLLTPVPELPAVITEAELRVHELAQLPLSVSTVFVVENRASYLAFPPVPQAMVIFGEGFGVTVLEGAPWLAERELVYWGDIDTHGFAILDRLRQRVAGVRSLLMDRQTLLDHLDRVVIEEHPTAKPLATLTAEEQILYRDLVEDRFGTSVRLEQERIRFSAVRHALEPWMTSDAPSSSRPEST